MEEMTPRVLPHVFELEIMRSWKCEGVMTLTIAQFCEDMKSFNDWSVGTEAIVESIDDGRNRSTFPPESFPWGLSSGTNDSGPRSEASGAEYQ